MIDAALQIVVIIACALIISRTEPAINRMSFKSPFQIQIAMHFLTVGGIGQIGAILIMGDVPTLATAIVIVGAAALLLCERRARFLAGAVRAPYKSQARGTQ